MPGYLNSSVVKNSVEGVITTTSNPQTFQMVDINKPMRYLVNEIRITCDHTSPNTLAIKLNNENSIIYVKAGETWNFDGTDMGMTINSITCVSAVGSKFSFEAGAEQTSYYV
jgi:hypothetical protein